VPRLPGAVEITGRVLDDRPIHCIVITNDEDQVVGAATIDADRFSGRGFRALAPSGDDTYLVYAILDRSPTPLLLGGLRRDEIEAS
jgi:hypothetical protein